jgi:hypothetical protein
MLRPPLASRPRRLVPRLPTRLEVLAPRLRSSPQEPLPAVAGGAGPLWHAMQSGRVLSGRVLSGRAVQSIRAVQSRRAVRSGLAVRAREAA